MRADEAKELVLSVMLGGLSPAGGLTLVDPATFAGEMSRLAATISPAACSRSTSL